MRWDEVLEELEEKWDEGSLTERERARLVELSASVQR